MFSKKATGLLMGSILVITSCTPKVGEKPPDQTQQKLEGTQCLSSLQPVIENFIAGTATDKEVADGWDCAATGIKTFKKYVYGRNSDRFETDELVMFLQENFLSPESPKINPALSTEFMRLKQLFLGGSLDHVTRGELDKIIDMLGQWKSLSLQLNPYMKLITQKWSIANSGNIQEDIRAFEKASDEIQKAAQLLATMIVENSQSYELDHFTTFIKEFSLFANQDWPLVNQLDRLMPVVKKVKKAVSGGDQDRIGPQEWRSFVLLGVRGYLQYLRYFYFIKSAAHTGSGIRLGYLARSIEDLLGAFQDLLLQKPVDPACGTVERENGTRRMISCISKKEVTEILTTFSDLWGELRVSDKLVDEGMRIKKVIFGGSDMALTSYDFERGKNKVAALKAVVEKFMPYYPIYSFEWDLEHFEYEAARDFFSRSQHSLQSSAEELGALFEDSYNLDHLIQLLAEIDLLYPPEDPEKKLATQAKKYIPLLKDVKNILFSQQSSQIEKGQWPQFLSLGARLYSAYQFYYFFVMPEEPKTLRHLDALHKIAKDFLKLTADVVELKESKIITLEEFQTLAVRMKDMDLLPKEFDAKSLQSLLDLVLNRVLWPAEFRLKGSKPNGFTAVSVSHLQREFQIWYETEKDLLTLTSSPVKPEKLQSAVAKKLKDPQISEFLKAGLIEVSRIISGPVPQTLSKEGHLVISRVASQDYDRASASQVNLNRLLSRLLIQATTTDLERLKKHQGVTLPEAQGGFDMIRPLVVQMGLLDKSNTTFMESRFREANIFVAHANGDSLMSFEETADLAGMILSGMKVNQLLRQELESTCTSPGRVKDDPSVSESCFRRVFNNKAAAYFKATPDYVKFHKALDSEEVEGFLENILKAAGHIPNSQNSVRLVDADLTPHVIQYIEMTMSKFDANKNGKIGLSDAKKAFPSFEGLLVELTKDQSLIKREDLLALFTYILYYGRPPEGVKDFLFKWRPWKNNPEKWNGVSADRVDLASILGYIADQVAAKAPQKRRWLSEKDVEIIQSAPEYREFL